MTSGDFTHARSPCCQPVLRELRKCKVQSRVLRAIESAKCSGETSAGVPRDAQSRLRASLFPAMGEFIVVILDRACYWTKVQYRAQQYTVISSAAAGKITIN